MSTRKKKRLTAREKRLREQFKPRKPIQGQRLLDHATKQNLKWGLKTLTVEEEATLERLKQRREQLREQRTTE